MKKMIGTTLLVLSWAYISLITGCFIVLLCMEGIEEGYYFTMDSKASFWMLLANAVLIWNYVISKAFNKIKIFIEHLKEKNKTREHANQVPIITFE